MKFYVVRGLLAFVVWPLLLFAAYQCLTALMKMGFIYDTVLGTAIALWPRPRWHHDLMAYVVAFSCTAAFRHDYRPAECVAFELSHYVCAGCRMHRMTMPDGTTLYRRLDGAELKQ